MNYFWHTDISADHRRAARINILVISKTIMKWNCDTYPCKIDHILCRHLLDIRAIVLRIEIISKYCRCNWTNFVHTAIRWSPRGGTTRATAARWLCVACLWVPVPPACKIANPNIKSVALSLLCKMGWESHILEIWLIKQTYEGWQGIEAIIFWLIVTILE